MYALSLSTTFAEPGKVIDNSYLENDGDSHLLKTSITGTDNKFDAININFSELPSENNQLVISVRENAKLEISGKTYFHSQSNTGYVNEAGVYAIHSLGTTNLLGDVDIVMTQNVDPQYGFNAIYAVGADGRVNIGSEGSTTRIWVLAAKPDAISAKQGGIVEFKSTNNQIVGTFDLWDNDKNTSGHESLIKGTFSGSSSYWFGDDTSTANSTPAFSIFGFHYPGNLNDGVLDLIFENGAQWSYLGFGNPLYGFVATAYDKRISNITLRNGGIINLADDVLLSFWDDIGLLDQMKGYSVKHDLVAIGDLKGSGGIFRLDLNAEDKTQSDVVFIEGSSDPGTHSLEPYQLDKLESITPNNTLIFAFVDDSAPNVKFVDKVNLEGESLYDYELTIDSSSITSDDLQVDEIRNKYPDVQGKDDYVGGTKWFIKRIDLSKSAAALAMTGAGFASYDAAIEMDRRDRRLLQTYKDDATGLWVRARHGERGVDNEYTYQLDGAVVGIDRQLSDTNTLGFAFTYEEGDTDFESVRGKGDMKRYELALYDTYDFGAPYIDLVGRLGMVSSDYNAYNQSATLKTSGDFDQKYASLSAEVGYTLMDNHGVFIEPQLQVQVAYLDGYDYSSDRDMEVDVDSEVAVLSRIGLRAGKHFDSSTINGEIYGRADVYHQFTDGQDAVFSDPTHKMRETWGTNKTYASLGLGSYLKVNDKWGLQFDIEKNMGGKTIDSWLITGQAKYQF